MVGTILNQNTARAARRDDRLLDTLSPIAVDLKRVEQLLGAQVEGFDEEVRQYVQYVLGGTGKRLRPSLALLAGGVTGRILDEHITLSVIVEMIHVATLVHDDVLDEAVLRHALPTANSRWGNEISVLVGDCLFAHALRLASGYLSTEVCRRISQATNTVCAGEILQTRKRCDLDLTIGEYLKIVHMKTGALFSVSSELGAWLNDAPTSLVKSMADYGANLGIAYQIFDDCVDIFGQERQAGKSLGTDMKKGKITLPYLLLLNHTDNADRKELGALILRGDTQVRAELNRMVQRNGVVDEALATIDQYIQKASDNIAMLPAGQHTETMMALLRYLADQSHSLLTQEFAVARTGSP